MDTTRDLCSAAETGIADYIARQSPDGLPVYRAMDIAEVTDSLQGAADDRIVVACPNSEPTLDEEINLQSGFQNETVTCTVSVRTNFRNENGVLGRERHTRYVSALKTMLSDADLVSSVNAALSGVRINEGSVSRAAQSRGVSGQGFVTALTFTLDAYPVQD